MNELIIRVSSFKNNLFSIVTISECINTTKYEDCSRQSRFKMALHHLSPFQVEVGRPEEAPVSAIAMQKRPL